MFKKIPFLALALSLCSAPFAWSDPFVDCENQCVEGKGSCFGSITVIDPIGMQQARDACADGYVECKKQCHYQSYPEEKKQADDEAERARQEGDRQKREQEQQDKGMGGINTIEFK